MAVENLNSVKLTNALAGDNNASAGTVSRGRVLIDNVTTVETTGSNGSTYLFGPLRTNIVPRYMAFASDGTADSPNVNVGLRHVRGKDIDGNVIADDPDALASALDIDGTGFADHVAIGSDYSANLGKPLWDWHADLSEDPQGEMYILLTLGADNVAAGDIQMLLEYLED